MHLKFESDARSHAEAYGTQQPAAYDFYLQGLGYLQDYVKAENVDNAIEVFDRALAKDPAFASANAGLGEAYWRKYQLTHDIHWADVAILNCRQAAKLDAALASAHICLGRVFLGTGKYEQALHEYDRAIEIEPNSDAAQAGLAYGYEQLNRPEDAERTFKKAIAARPNYWATYNWLGLFYQRHGRYDDASAMYSQVVSLAPDSFTGYSNLGGIRVIEGKYAEAIPLLQQSLKIQPLPRQHQISRPPYFKCAATRKRPSSLRKPSSSTIRTINSGETWVTRTIGHPVATTKRQRRTAKQFASGNKTFESTLTIQRRLAT